MYMAGERTWYDHRQKSSYENGLGLEYPKILSFPETAGQELLSAKLDERPGVQSKFQTLPPRH